MEKIITYTDGGARGNPGPAGVGVYVTTSKGEVVREVKKAIGNGTNNFAEYYAVVLALETLKQIYGKKTKEMQFEMRLDSELVKKQLSGEYQIKEPGLVPLFIEIHNHQVASFPHLTFVHVPRAQNKEADRLVNEALDGKVGTMTKVGQTESRQPAVIKLYLTSLAFLSGVFIATFYTFSWPILVWLMLLAVTFAVLYRRTASSNSHLSLWLILTLALTGLALGAARVMLAQDSFGHSPHEAAIGAEVSISGVVNREPEERTVMQQLYVATESDVVLVSTDRYVPIEYGDRVTVRGTLRRPESFVSEYGRTFNYPGYLLARGVEYQIPFAEVTVVEKSVGNPVIASLLKVKEALTLNIEKHLAEPAAGLGEGLLLGVKGALGEYLEAAFRTTGVIHIVVLSGYNIMLIVAFVLYVLSFFLPLRPRVIIGLVAVLLFALMVGLSATVVRASLMAMILLLAQLLGRTYLALRALILAAVVMVGLNPFLLVYDIGFQLSFLATLGLILVAPVIERWLATPSWFMAFRSLVLSTVATQIAVLPLLLYHVGELPVLSIIVNVMVLPLVPVAMLLTFLVASSGLFSGAIAAVFSYPAYVSLQYIIAVAQGFAALPFASIVLPPFPFYLVIVMYVAIGLAMWQLSRARRPEASPALTSKNSTETNLSDWTIVEEEDEIKMPTDTKTVASRPATTASDTPIFFC